MVTTNDIINGAICIVAWIAYILMVTAIIAGTFFCLGAALAISAQGVMFVFRIFGG